MTAATRAVGRDLPRKDALAKVTGAARYAADFDEPGTVHGWLVTSTVPKGRVRRFDLGAALAVPGVLTVLTHENLPPYEEVPCFYDGGPGQASFWPMRTPEVRYAGQIVAYVVAQTREAAREAAALVRVEYDAEPGAVVALGDDPAEPAKSAKPPKVGDVEEGLRAAAHRLVAGYRTPIQHHNPIELYATTAFWRGDRLTVYLPSQAVRTTQLALAKQLGLEKEQVRVVSPFVGGAFGSKGSVMAHTTLTALAARLVGRPVKLVVGRDQMFTVGSFRAETRQEVTLAADGDGRLLAYRHAEDHGTSRFDEVVNAGVPSTARMYACPRVEGVERVVRRDTNSPGFMRAPNEVPSFFALESAVDEFAWQLDLDPVELRLRNEPDKDPVKGVPFSSRSLVRCYRRGAELFGWHRRVPKMGATRDGDELVGWGCATATYPTHLNPCAVRVQLAANGTAHVQATAVDIGTGTYTIAAQVAADELGLPVEAVSVELGDSVHPTGPIAGGSTTAASLAAAIHQACGRVRSQLALAGGADGLPLPEAVRHAPGGVIEAEVTWSHPEAKEGSPAKLEEGGYPAIGPVTASHAMFAFGAEFAEVRVDRWTGAVRVPRLVGVFAAGTILNPRTARSQLLGGMIWGLGSALHEATEVDRRRARFVNANIAEYLVPVSADVGEVVVEMLPEEDRHVNPLGAKGIGELGIVGTAAAIANAVYHATGVRVRELPIRMEKLLGALQA